MSDNNPPPPAPSSQGGETKNNLDHLPVAHIIDVSGDASTASLLDALPLVLAEPGEPPTSPTSPTIVNAWNKNTSASLDFTRLAALYDQGFSLAGSAKEADEEAGDYELSRGLWSQAVDTFVRAATIEPDPRKVALLEQNVSQFLIKLASLTEKIQNQELQQLQQLQLAQQQAKATKNTAVQDRNRQLESAQFYLEQAMVADEQQTNKSNSSKLRSKSSEDPLVLYEKAAGLYLKLSRMEDAVVDETSRTQYLQRTSDILDRMEALKKGTHNSTSTTKSTPPTSPTKGNNNNGGTNNNGGNNNNGGGGHGTRLSAAEKQVLANSSRINGRLYFPWLGQMEASERFTTSSSFIDPDGLLQLSTKQKKHLSRWSRPSEFMVGAPTMIKLISPYTIRQELVTDCSFVSSLCIAASYERRSGKQLITSIIYPQNRMGVPVYNPCGKYMVKLWLNGVARKVVVDDRLPIGRKRNGSARMLGSYTTSKNELWVSIIEKAYMKIHGGYDFPGSNSGIDLYALTGW